MPLELKSNPSTSPTHPGSLAHQQSLISKIRHRAVWHEVECYTCLPKGFTLLPGTPKPVAPNTVKTHRFLQKQRTARGNDTPFCGSTPPRICKVPWRSRGASFFEKARPPILPRRPFGLVKHMVWRVRFLSYFLKSLQKRTWYALPPFWLPRATFNATTQNTPVHRDWRSVGGPCWPKRAWHSRGVHIIKKFLFNSSSRIHAVRRVLRDRKSVV